MAAPAYAAHGGLAGAGSTAADITIPTGVVLNSLILVPLYVEVAQAVTAPSGFAAETGYNAPVIVGGSKPFYQHVFWKRQTSATGAGETTGTYGFTVAAGVAWRAGYAIRYTGVVESGNPFDFTDSEAQPTDGPGPFPAVSGTTTGADRLLVLFNATWNGRTVTPPAGFTHRAINTVEFCDMAQAAAGPTGSISATFTGGNSSQAAWLGALKPVGAESEGSQTNIYIRSSGAWVQSAAPRIRSGGSWVTTPTGPS